MKRKTGIKGLVLTLNEEYSNITNDEAKKLCKKLLSALRDKAKRENWSYVIWVFFSRKEQDPDPVIERYVKHKRTAKRPHYHVILYANPCRTVVDWLQRYWNTPKKSKRKRLGIVSKHDIQDCNAFMGYCDRQKAFKERRQEYGESLLENGKDF